MEHDGVIYVPLLMADNPGNGALSRYLDQLEASTDKAIRIPNVINPRLEAYLARRGYQLRQEWAAQFEEMVDVWERGAKPTDAAGKGAGAP